MSKRQADEREQETQNPEDYMSETDFTGLRERIAEMKRERSNRKAEDFIKNLPKGKYASELGVPCVEYACRVMASQSSAPDVVPPLLAVARVRRALKAQGYKMDEIEKVCEQLEDQLIAI